MDYVQNTDVGFDRFNIVAVDLPKGEVPENSISFINELKKHQQIIDVSLTSSIPPSLGSTLFSDVKDPHNPDKNIRLQFIVSDENFCNAMGLEIVNGTYYQKDNTANKNKIVINEEAAKVYGFDDPIGKSIEINEKNSEIIGIVKNFYTKSFYEPLSPLVIMNGTNMFTNKFALRYKTGEVKQAMEILNTKWREFFPYAPLNYTFLDDEFDKVYKADLRFSDLILFFTMVAVLIAVIGLAGLVAFTTSQKVKEIGIRKVLGASIRNIFVLLTREILIYSFIGCLISFPIAIYLMEKWLNHFAYKESFNPVMFILIFILTVLLAFSTVAFQTFRAANADPVKTLRYE
jgi:putative ABC transport system permease protein